MAWKGFTFGSSFTVTWKFIVFAAFKLNWSMPFCRSSKSSFEWSWEPWFS